MSARPISSSPLIPLPPGLSVRRPRWLAPAFLLIFAVCSARLDQWILPITHTYGHILSALTDVPPSTFGKQASVAVRPFFLTIEVLFSIMASGPLLRRLRLLGTTVLVFSALVLATDLALTFFSLFGGPRPFGAIGNVIAGLDGIAALPGTCTRPSQGAGITLRQTW